ncbi:MAG TPA: DUF3105 domain-containing protein [Candidatus Binatia bacterium]|nr:DUF3105 domain-containing protein [Candidatus Binatia bacterium]
MTSIRSRVAVPVLLALVSIPGIVRSAPAPCPARRYVVTAGADRLAGGSGEPVVLALAENSIAVVGGCSPAKQRLRTKRHGTKLSLRWPSCGDLAGMRLRGALDESCQTMLGKVRARRAGAVQFAAVPSLCGDGIVDAGAGEECDGATCAGGEECGSCRCIGSEPGPANCVTTAVPIEGFNHVEIGSDLFFASNPPSSGNHYPVWAEFKSYTETVPRGFWVHDLEHGAVVLLHRPDAGSEVIDALRAAYDAIPLDPKCTHRRAVLTPDPLMPQPFAVVSWGFRMLCDAVDQQAILDFTALHRDDGRESLCAEGGFHP